MPKRYRRRIDVDGIAFAIAMTMLIAIGAVLVYRIIVMHAW